MRLNRHTSLVICPLYKGVSNDLVRYRGKMAKHLPSLTCFRRSDCSFRMVRLLVSDGAMSSFGRSDRSFRTDHTSVRNGPYARPQLAISPSRTSARTVTDCKLHTCRLYAQHLPIVGHIPTDCMPHTYRVIIFPEIFWWFGIFILSVHKETNERS